MSVKNLLYSKLARQNIFCFINSISILVILTYCYYYSHLYSYYYYHYCFYYWYHYYYYFIVIIVVIIIVLSVIHVIHFISFYFIPYCLYYYDFCLRVVCDVICPPQKNFIFVFVFFVFFFVFFFFFFVNDLHFILALLIHVFLLPLSFISSSSSSLSFYLFSTTSHWGRIQQMNSSGMVCPCLLIILGKS